MKSWVIYSCLILEDGFVRNCEFVISCWYGEICSGYVDMDDNAIVNDKERQSCHHIDPRQLICFANQLTGFYIMGTLVFNELNRYYLLICEVLSHMNLLETPTGGFLQKNVFLKISQNSQESTCARVSFLITLQASGTGVFL